MDPDSNGKRGEKRSRPDLDSLDEGEGLETEPATKKVSDGSPATSSSTNTAQSNFNESKDVVISQESHSEPNPTGTKDTTDASLIPSSSAPDLEIPLSGDSQELSKRSTKKRQREDEHKGDESDDEEAETARQKRPYLPDSDSTHGAITTDGTAINPSSETHSSLETPTQAITTNSESNRVNSLKVFQSVASVIAELISLLPTQETFENRHFNIIPLLLGSISVVHAQIGRYYAELLSPSKTLSATELSLCQEVCNMAKKFESERGAWEQQPADSQCANDQIALSVYRILAQNGSAAFSACQRVCGRKGDDIEPIVVPKEAKATAAKPLTKLDRLARLSFALVHIMGIIHNNNHVRKHFLNRRDPLTTVFRVKANRLMVDLIRVYQRWIASSTREDPNGETVEQLEEGIDMESWIEKVEDLTKSVKSAMSPSTGSPDPTPPDLVEVARVAQTVNREFIAMLLSWSKSAVGQLNITEKVMSVMENAGLRSDDWIDILQRSSPHGVPFDFPWKRYNMRDVNELFTNLQNKQWQQDVITKSHQVFGLLSKTRNFFPFDYRGIPFRFKDGTLNASDAASTVSASTGVIQPNEVDSNETPTSGYFAIDTPEDEYQSITIITDYFQERERMRGTVKNENRGSPLEYWTRYWSDIVRGTYQTHPGRLLSFDLREYMFKKGPKECTQFKVTLVKAVLEKLGATRYLDMSAGWGDRLIGAMATSTIQRYVGVDPNTDLRPGHDNIIETLYPLAVAARPNGPKPSYEVIYEPFQTSTLPKDEMFDLAFTSPPYFDFEIYTHRPGQSVADHSRFDDWLVHFLLKSLQKAWGVLVDRGHLAIHITDTRDGKCCEIMNLFIQAALPDSVYEGIIGSFGGRKDVVRPIWVWRRDARAQFHTQRRKEDALSFARQHYPQYWQLIERYLLSSS